MRALMAQPFVPGVHALAGLSRHLQHLDVRIDLAGIGDAALDVEADCGSRSVLFSSISRQARNMCGYLAGLSSPSVIDRRGPQWVQLVNG